MDDRRMGSEQDGIWVPPGAERTLKSEAPEPTAEPAEGEAGPGEEAVDYHDKYLRALAEMENVRRRTQEQQRTAVSRANENFVEALLPVLDNVERGLSAARAEATVESLQQGLDLVGKQLQTFLENQGVELIGCDVGEAFDPELHEAMMRGPATDEVPEGHILAVYERGFRYGGRVLRPARVSVAAAPLDASA